MIALYPVGRAGSHLRRDGGQVDRWVDGTGDGYRVMWDISGVHGTPSTTRKSKFVVLKSLEFVIFPQNR